MVNRIKFRLGDIVEDEDGQRHVAVDRDLWKFKSVYRIVAIDGNRKRWGPARWVASHLLKATGEHSNTGSIRTYRANEELEAESGDRGCRCQCCVHVAMDKKDFTNSGRYKYE